MRYFLLAILLLLPAPRQSSASDPLVAVSSQGAQILNFPRGVRNLAMGWVGAADDSDPANLFYNPANIFLMNDFALTEGHNTWISNVDFFDIGGFAGKNVALRDRATLNFAGGLRYTTLRIEPVDIRTIFLPDSTGRSAEGNDWYLTVALAGGLSFEWLDIGVGFSVKPVRQGLADSRVDAWAFDMGALAKARLAHDSGIRFVPSVGVSVLNLGNDVDFGSFRARLPRRARYGVGLRIETPSLQSLDDRLGYAAPLLTFSTNVDYIDQTRESAEDGTGVGFEMGLRDIVFLRAGHKDGISGTGASGGTYGVGLRWRVRVFRLGFDYARFPATGLTDDVNAYGASLALAF